ncbi:LexA family protein [Gemella bergeri]
MKNNKEVVEMVKQLTKEQNMSMSELARRVGIAKSAISRYFNGTRELPLNRIEDFARALHTTSHILLGVEPETQKGIKIPVLGTVAAGIPIEAIEDIIDYEEIPYSWKNQGEFFGLRISGDSMLPDITDNDIVIVRQQSTADSGDTVIALVNGDDATCKRLQRQTNGIMLIPNNSSYPTYFYSNEEIENLPVKIVGKVVELRRKF